VRSRWAVLIVVALGAWAAYRWLAGRSLAGAGHASPEDAIAWGWSVFPAGISGWYEVSPDGGTRVMHASGWTGDPYLKTADS